MKVHIGPCRKNRKVDIRVDDYDVWNADVTMAAIIVEVLKKYREDIGGSPYVQNEDVPERLHMTKEQTIEFLEGGETDSQFHERWKYVVDEMIYAMNVVAHNDIHYEYSKEQDERVSNGLILFGKYMRAIWT
jgi:hypothetical protein